MALVRAHAFITGKVQGVYYRQTTADHARRLELTGWVCNVPDGRVELVAEGNRRIVEELLAWCHRGPPAARVDKVEVEWSDATGEVKVFEVRG